MATARSTKSRSNSPFQVRRLIEDAGLGYADNLWKRWQSSAGLLGWDDFKRTGHLQVHHLGLTGDQVDKHQPAQAAFFQLSLDDAKRAIEEVDNRVDAAALLDDIDQIEGVDAALSLVNQYAEVKVRKFKTWSDAVDHIKSPGAVAKLVTELREIVFR